MHPLHCTQTPEMEHCGQQGCRSTVGHPGNFDLCGTVPSIPKGWVQSGVPWLNHQWTRLVGEKAAVGKTRECLSQKDFLKEVVFWVGKILFFQVYSLMLATFSCACLLAKGITLL